MPKLTNKSARVIHIDGTMLVPGMEGEVMDEAMGRASVKALMDAGELEAVKAKAAAEPKPAPPADTPKG